jgi:hypothetical protein
MKITLNGIKVLLEKVTTERQNSASQKEREEKQQPPTPCLFNCGVLCPYSNSFLNLVRCRRTVAEQVGLNIPLSLHF